MTYRYGRGAILITTSKSVRDWTELLAGDEALAAAILDCLLHKAHVLNIIPFLRFLPEIRKVIYTTNAIESLNMVMRKYTRNRRISPNDDAALKALLLAIREASKNWK